MDRVLRYKTRALKCVNLTSRANFEVLSETGTRSMVVWEVAQCTYLVYKISSDVSECVLPSPSG